ncbi:transmembrane protein 17 isoform X1 [Sphaerodactylus townsendi]|uniref:transmembrane protein 17 isoform X1 n=1 Tax=Sphaerodactylus townsendi TaxID=933632 RepID=UPI002026452E|nr:transmembrane protein 17 isoform X1 [Sphaerodactylus townsendi]
MALPEPVRRRLSSFSRTVFTDNNRTGPESGSDDIGPDVPLFQPLFFPILVGEQRGHATAEVPSLTGLLQIHPGDDHDNNYSDRGYPSVPGIHGQFTGEVKQRTTCGQDVCLESLVMTLHSLGRTLWRAVTRTTTRQQCPSSFCGQEKMEKKVPELAGFWLLSLFLQLPLILFLLLNEGLEIQPLERAIHIVFLAFLVFQVAVAFLALKKMVNQLATRFRLREFDRLDNPLPSDPQGGLKTRAETLWGVGSPAEGICSTSIGWRSALRS